MIISLDWLKKYTNIDMPVKDLVTLIGSRFVEVEEVIDLGAKYRDIMVVSVVESNQLEGSDHLSLLKIDDGGVSQKVQRDENGLIQVVCGAPNVKARQLVVWLPPESIVPSTYGTAEPFVIGIRKLLGVISNGMIASVKELDLYDEHEGILEITDDIKPGTLFADVYGLDDYLLDIENKSLTHRPDCFGIVGFAREVAAIAGKLFITPTWLMNLTPKYDDALSNEVKLSVSIDDPELSSRYQAIVMTGADGSKKSPLQIQTYLSRVGVRPINAVVDVTNYLMMLTGQPLHAFDYDKLVVVGGGSADIHVRAGRENESLELLDGRMIEIMPDDIVIAAGETAIALAGAMGGLNTEIDANTKNIIIESATFNLYNLRATQMRHGIFSEAITRFTKGQPASLTAPVLFEAVRLMSEWSGAKCISKMSEMYPVNSEKVKIDFTGDTINNILGSSFNDDEIVTTLQNVEFKVSQSDSGTISAAAPYWRSDIHIVEDIVEEVGRINGFDNIDLQLPLRDFTSVSINDFDTFRCRLRNILVRAGANEILSYSFIHGSILQKSGQDVSNSYKIVNSISPDLQYYRQSLTPNLIDLIHPNIKQGFDCFALFEINKAHFISNGLNDEKVPIESEMLALTIANKNNSSGAPYYQAKRILDYLCKSVNVAIKYEPFDCEPNDPESKPFEYRRSAKVIDEVFGELIGIVGEYKKSVKKGFKLPDYSAGFEINLQVLFDLSKKSGFKYCPPSRYPSSERDICFQVNDKIMYSQIINAANIASAELDLEVGISPVDIYQSSDSKTKNITIRVKFTSRGHTLTGDEVSAAIGTISSAVIDATQATVI